MQEELKPPEPLWAESADRQLTLMMWLLLGVYTLNFLDRQIINILAEPIKRDLRLTDTELGLLAGPAFALFYTLLGLPIARYADKASTNRVRLVAGTVALWSAMTAICGSAQNFLHLLIARMGVGVGEAGCTPAAHSLITESVAPSRRASAIAFYGMGVPIGSLLGLSIGGIVNDLYGWRSAFLLVGAPGIVLALLLVAVLHDPRVTRRVRTERQSPGSNAPTFVQLSRQMFALPAFRFIMVGAAMNAFLGFGRSLWTTSFLIRSHGLSTTQAGLAMAVVLGIAGTSGIWSGGKAADILGGRNARHVLIFPALGAAVAVPLLLLGYLVPDWRLAVALLSIATFFSASYYGPTYSSVQTLVAPDARAIAASIVLFGQSLVGVCFGPLAFGAVSDLLQPIYGQESVRYVLYGAAGLEFVCAFCLWQAGRRLPSR